MSLPRLVILDGHTLNPGDLDWGPLRAVAECTIFDRSPAADVVARAQGARLLLTNKTPVPRAVIEALPELKFIGVLATGWNVVDGAAARERGIPVSNVPGYGTASVAQHVFALLLELTQQTGHHARTVREGRWSGQPDFCYWDTPLVELAGKTLGIVGWGSIGQAVGRIGEAFGMKVITATRTPREGVNGVALNELFATADVVSLHCPLTPETQHLVNADRLAAMKPGAFLINTGRGPLIDEAALAAALHAGRLGGVALDVLSVEPPPADHPLLASPRCLITPHLAWATLAARQRLLDQVVENVRAFLAGAPRCVVN